MFTFKHNKPRKTGIMVVGLRGNSGSTFQGSIIANQNNVSWKTKNGLQTANLFGSLSQSAVIPIRVDGEGVPLYRGFQELLDMTSPLDLVVGCCNISDSNLREYMERSGMFHVNRQENILKHVAPLPSILYPEPNTADPNDIFLGRTPNLSVHSTSFSTKIFKVESLTLTIKVNAPVSNS